MKPILVDCVSCAGTGRTTLSPAMTKLLRLISLSPSNASELYAKLNRLSLSRSAINQSLNRLTKLGLVKSRKSGRELRVYFPA